MKSLTSEGSVAYPGGRQSAHPQLLCCCTGSCLPAPVTAGPKPPVQSYRRRLVPSVQGAGGGSGHPLVVLGEALPEATTLDSICHQPGCRCPAGRPCRHPHVGFICSFCQSGRRLLKLPLETVLRVLRTNMAAGGRTRVRACPSPACVQAHATTPHPCSPPGLGVPPPPPALGYGRSAGW